MTDAGRPGPALIALGECMIELWSEEPDSRTFRRSIGGDTLNVVAAASRAGLPSAYLTALGDDPLGVATLADIGDLGVDISRAVVRQNARTGLYLVKVDEHGDRSFSYYREGSAASTMGPDDIDLGWLLHAQMLHVSGISQAISASMRAAVLCAARAMRRAKKRVSFDVNFRPRLWGHPEMAISAIRELMPVDVFACSTADLELLSPGSHPEDAAARALAGGAEVCVISAGARGAYIATCGHAGWVPAPLVPVVRDTTAAGDFMLGAFLAGLLRGSEPAEAARLANVVAAFTIQRPGSVSSLPTKDEMRRIAREVG